MAEINHEQLQRIVDRLAQRENELQAEIRAAREASEASESEATTEVDDQVAAGEERLRSGIEHVQLQRDQEELADIETARTRIDGGSYGECVECALSIPFERLAAQPTALRCITCQSVWEKSHDAAPRYRG